MIKALAERKNYLSIISNSLPVKYVKHASIALVAGAALTLAPIPDGIACYLGLTEAAAPYALSQGTGIWSSYIALQGEELTYCSKLADRISSGELDSVLVRYTNEPSQLIPMRDMWEGLVRQRIGDPKADAIIDRCLDESLREAVRTGSKELYNIAEGAAQLNGDFLKASELGYKAHPDRQIDYRKDILDGFRQFLIFTETENFGVVDNIIDKSY